MPYSDPTKARQNATLRQREYVKRHPERTKERSRRHYARLAEWAEANGVPVSKAKRLAPFRPRDGEGTRNEHGLTSAAYRDLVESQGGRCALCEMVAPLCVDHEHVDGWSKLPPRERAKHVRGLLCAPCNLFIGHCREDVTVMVQKSQRIALGVEAYLRRKP